MKNFIINYEFLNEEEISKIKSLLTNLEPESRLRDLKTYFLTNEDILSKCKTNNVDPCIIAFCIYKDNLL
jgi:hypothetical protein